MPTKDDFTAEIDAQLSRARQQGRPHAEINAGELHRKVGGYPPESRANHAMPNCCAAMRDRMGRADEIIFETDSGQSASLTIKYNLVRQ